MRHVALMREDTGETLSLHGCTSYGIDYPGRVTDHPIPDRTYIADGLTLLPRMVSLTARIDDTSDRPTYTTDVARYLEECRADGASVSVMERDGEVVEMMVVESWRKAVGLASGWMMSLELKGARMASARSIELSAVEGAPSGDYATATQDPVDKGQGAAEETPQDISFAAGIRNTLGAL